MGRRRPFGAIAAWSVRHARAVLAVAGLIAVAAAVAATQVDTDAGLSTLVSKGDPTYQATQGVRDEFGEEPVVVLVKGSYGSRMREIVAALRAASPVSDSPTSRSRGDAR